MYKKLFSVLSILSISISSIAQESEDGVGLAKGAGHLNLASIGRIVTSWLITIPVGATLCILFYVFLRLIFNV